MQVGYIGLGNMGGALAQRLQLSCPLMVYDLHQPSVDRLVEEGATAAANLPALAAACDVVMLCLPTSAHVRRALFGEGGLVAALRPGTLVVDQTTGDPVETRAMAQELAKRGIAMVDAPVSGGAAGAQAGTIAIMIGASTGDLARVRPLLEMISPNLFHAGDIGAGQVIKLVNNMMSAAQRLLTFEAVALAAKNGIAPDTACEILMSGGARNTYLEKFMVPQVITGKLHKAFTLGLMHKDVKLACDLASSSGVPLFLANVAREFYQMCVTEKGYDGVVDSAAQVMDRIAGTRVVPEVG